MIYINNGDLPCTRRAKGKPRKSIYRKLYANQSKAPPKQQNKKK